MSSEINKVLAERGANYGDFAFVAFRSQQIQNHLRDMRNWSQIVSLNPS